MLNLTHPTYDVIVSFEKILHIFSLYHCFSCLYLSVCALQLQKNRIFSNIDLVKSCFVRLFSRLAVSFKYFESQKYCTVEIVEVF